jgi:hypothetical protein
VPPTWYNPVCTRWPWIILVCTWRLSQQPGQACGCTKKKLKQLLYSESMTPAIHFHRAYFCQNNTLEPAHFLQGLFFCRVLVFSSVWVPPTTSENGRRTHVDSWTTIAVDASKCIQWRTYPAGPALGQQCILCSPVTSQKSVCMDHHDVLLWYSVWQPSHLTCCQPPANLLHVRGKLFFKFMACLTHSIHHRYCYGCTSIMGCCTG